MKRYITSMLALLLGLAVQASAMVAPLPQSSLDLSSEISQPIFPAASSFAQGYGGSGEQESYLLVYVYDSGNPYNGVFCIVQPPLGLEVELASLDDIQKRVSLGDKYGRWVGKADNEKLKAHLVRMRSTVDSYLEGMYTAKITGDRDMSTARGAKNQLAHIFNALNAKNAGVNIRIELHPYVDGGGGKVYSDDYVNNGGPIVIALQMPSPNDTEEVKQRRLARMLGSTVHEGMHVLEAIERKGTNRKLLQDVEIAYLLDYIKRRASTGVFLGSSSPADRGLVTETQIDIIRRHVNPDFVWADVTEVRNIGGKGVSGFNPKYMRIADYLSFWLLGFDPEQYPATGQGKWPEMKYYPKQPAEETK